MKKYILLPLLTLICLVVFAQEPDTTRTEEPSPVLQDTIPTPPTTKVETVEEEPPRIIYYQSTDDNIDRRRKRRRRHDIKTLSGSMSHSGGFGALSFRTTDFNDQSMVLAGLRGGWIINRTLGIGVEGHGVIPTAKFDNIEAGREVNILGGYGGMFLELIFFSNEVVHVTFPTSGGAGWLGYHLTDSDNLMPASPDGDEVDSDVFWYLEPGANLEFNISRNFRLNLGVSKRFTQDFDLQNTDSDEFENLNYYITLKIGGF